MKSAARGDFMSRDRAPGVPGHAGLGGLQYLEQRRDTHARVKLTASKPEELIVNGTLVTDTLVREIDGADDGHPGTDYIATISGTRCDRQRNSRGDRRSSVGAKAAPAGGRYGRSRSFACSR